MRPPRPPKRNGSSVEIDRERERGTEEDNDSDAIKFALGSWSPPELILSL